MAGFLLLLDLPMERFVLDICTVTGYGILAIRTFRHRGLKRLFVDGEALDVDLVDYH
jgi:hypothetical protein